MSTIHKVLIANRGEIACRILRTCRALGIATVAVFSDADASARHVREADEAVRIGASAPVASYLNAAALIEAAERTGADALHPGYGFLAEHAPFAAACQSAGVIFIGPPPAVIAQMGSKRTARQMMAAAGVPVVPGYDGEEQSDERFRAAAREIGYPVMVKAAAGGGGKGMRVVASARDLPAALAAARREALAAFADDTLLLERALEEPRHIEFQIFGDAQGHLLHLGERECTIQRRHQKIIEETPSTALTPELRARMADAALRVGRQLAYTNAGTVEFMLDAAGNFYFLEVNTRLQVEHPITELVTGLDLVAWQILVAEGHPLPLTQDAIHQRGHAIEVRVYAEDPASGFLPATGTIARWEEPEGAGIRVESGILSGDEVTPYYDPLLAKICAHGAERGEALRCLDYALGATTLFGVRNNLDFLRRALRHPAHVAGTFSTAFVARHSAELLTPVASAPDLTAPTVAVAVWRLLALPAAHDGVLWRNNPNRPHADHYVSIHPVDGQDAANTARADGTPTSLDVRLWTLRAGGQGGALTASVSQPDGTERSVAVRIHSHSATGEQVLELDGHLVRCIIAAVGDYEWWVKLGDTTHVLRWHSPLPEPSERGPRAGSLVAPMPGQVVDVLVAEGQVVQAGDALLILEAMKMEHMIVASRAGIVASIHFHAGESVPAGAILLDLTPG